MKKLYAFFAVCAMLILSGTFAYAAEFNVVKTNLTRGAAYESYNAQIEMQDGNDGYTFSFDSGILPTGLTVNEDGSITGIPKSAGDFPIVNICISHSDGTRAVVTFHIFIAPRPIWVVVTAPTVEYDGEYHDITVECYDYVTKEPLEEGLIPSVFYDCGSERLSQVKDANIYYITVRPPSGCSIELQEGDKYFIIKKNQNAQIFVQDQQFKYVKGQSFPITDVRVEPVEAGYIAEYRKKGNSEYTTDAPTEPGVYTVRVKTTNPNYEQIEEIVTLTVSGAALMNLGNSPAALILSENVSDEEKERNLSAFKSDHIFRGINYRSFNIAGIDENLDENKYTVIVSDINKFKDPGLYDEVLGNLGIKGSDPEPINGANDLYKVTYSSEDFEELFRYVMVVRRIGDANGDGYVNAVDANHLDKANKNPETVSEARVWDVNKDGKLDKYDAAAIRNRFYLPLEAYYPWAN